MDFDSDETPAGSVTDTIIDDRSMSEIERELAEE